MCLCLSEENDTADELDFTSVSVVLVNEEGGDSWKYSIRVSTRILFCFLSACFNFIDHYAEYN